MVAFRITQNLFFTLGPICSTVFLQMNLTKLYPVPIECLVAAVVIEISSS